MNKNDSEKPKKTLEELFADDLEQVNGGALPISIQLPVVLRPVLPKNPIGIFRPSQDVGH